MENNPMIKTVGGYRIEHKLEVVNLNIKHEMNDNDDFGCIKREDDSVKLDRELMDELLGVKAEVELPEVYVKCESITIDCSVCFAQLPDDDAYYEHMNIHRTEGECASDAYQSQCEHSPALRTTTRAPHTRSTSRGSSLRTGHKESSNKFHQDVSEDCTQNMCTLGSKLLNAGGEEIKTETTTQHNREKKKKILQLDKSKKHCKNSNTKLKLEHSQLNSCSDKNDLNSVYTCDVCLKTFHQKILLAKHMVHHTRPISCHLCDFKSAHKYSLRVHMRKHTGEKPFVCKVCNAKFAHEHYMAIHMRTHTSEKPFACQLCDYKCTQRGHLDTHMKVHTGEKPYACSVCNYKCNMRSNLNAHMRYHTGEKPFACDVCKFRCNRSSNLLQHMRTHTGVKPYSCNLCNYKCSFYKDLVKHIRTHTGDKPFACHLCDYRSVQKSSLNSHLKTHTAKKPIICKVCNYKCSKGVSLANHMRTHDVSKEP